MSTKPFYSSAPIETFLLVLVLLPTLAALCMEVVGMASHSIMEGDGTPGGGNIAVSATGGISAPILETHSLVTLLLREREVEPILNDIGRYATIGEISIGGKETAVKNGAKGAVGEDTIQRTDEGISRAPAPASLASGAPKKRPTKAQKKTAKKWRDKRQSRMPEGAPATTPLKAA